MKIGLLADIHANVDALRACLRSARQEGVVRLLVAGDFVGYYYFAHEIMALLDEWEWSGVRGNHEEMLVAWQAGRDRDAIHRRYGSGIAMAAELLDEEQLTRLERLPQLEDIEVDGRRAVMFHGTPTSTTTYVYPSATAADIAGLTVPEADIIVCGHTHYPVIWSVRGGLIVNPGSVGQPRNRVPGAHWAIWDTATGLVDKRVEQYDMQRLVAECRRRDPHLPYLSEVLLRI